MTRTLIMLKRKYLTALLICHFAGNLYFYPTEHAFRFISSSFAAETTDTTSLKHESERGPHNGKLLKKDNLAAEVTIYETNTPPQFRIYLYDKNIPINPSDVKLNIALKRIDGEVDNFDFTPSQDYLSSDKTVVEPHSFDVEIKATYKGVDYLWNYPSYEGRVKISPSAAKAAGIETEKAGPIYINEVVSLTGQVVLNANKTVDVRARFPGVVKELFANVGQPVKKDQSLLKVESNGTLELYNINSPQDGIVIARNTNIGDLAMDKPLVTISDLSTIWLKFHAFPKDISRIKLGNPVTVQTLDKKHSANSTINFLSPIVDEATQSTFAIAELTNSDNLWKAGTTIKGDVLVSKEEVPVAVKTSALQKFRDFTVVFAQYGDEYEVRMLELGKNDGEWVEVISGIKPGTSYVTKNSFIIKAELEKGGATHDH